jgi:hypothetical protein
MDRAYLANVIDFLRQDAHYYWKGAVRRDLICAMGEVLYNQPGEMFALRGLGAPTTADCSPDAWLAATPLMRALLSSTRAE